MDQAKPYLDQRSIPSLFGRQCIIQMRVNFCGVTVPAVNYSRILWKLLWQHEHHLCSGRQVQNSSLFLTSIHPHRLVVLNLETLAVLKKQMLFNHFQTRIFSGGVTGEVALGSLEATHGFSNP